MMIGLPGSGKSTISQELASDSGMVRVALDSISIKEGDEEPTKELYEQAVSVAITNVVNALRYGVDVIYDALNINSEQRISFIRRVKELYTEPLNIVANLVLTCVEDCIERDTMRQASGGHSVGQEKIYRNAMCFQPPTYEEGFSSIQFYGGGRSLIVSKVFDKLPINIRSHSLTVAEKINNNVLKVAGKYHDIGKFYIDSDKPEAHAFFGAYVFLCSDLTKLYCTGGVSQTALDIALIIAYHMLPVTFPTYERYSKEFAKLPLPNYLQDFVYLLHSFNHPERIAL
jgi:predicted ABC-type ATPase